MCISLLSCSAVQMTPLWTTGGWGPQDMLKSKLTVLAGCRRKACWSMVSYWGRNKGNFRVGCIHRTFMEEMCVICPSTDKMQTLICLRSWRCGSCLGAIEGNKNHQVFRKHVLEEHCAFKLLKGSRNEGGNQCFPCPLEQELAQIIFRLNYLGLY